MTDSDTIAAIATPAGRGGIGIIRLSGEKALTICETLTGASLSPRQATFASYRDDTGSIIDQGINLYFPGPHSFTGEDVVEFQAHGGPVILDMLLRLCCESGARLAKPGEFSERAYLNGKLDLAQAEAIADLINSQTEQAVINASRSLQGEFSRKITDLVEKVTALRVYVEAAIDFPEEEIDFIEDGQVQAQLDDITQQLDQVMQTARQGTLVQEGMKIVIAGKPNAGKSSLLNALSGQDTAIVTPIEGTTRDVLRENIQLDGMPLHIVDTAGLRESTDEVEQEGIRRAWRELETADSILFVIDASKGVEQQVDISQFWPSALNSINPQTPVITVYNKSDLSGCTPSIDTRDSGIAINLSAKTGAGMDLLRSHLKKSMGYQESGEGQFSARRRHLESLDRAAGFLFAGQRQLLNAGASELLADDLHQCQKCLGEITGEFTSDDLLGEIFSSFCIGK